MPSRNQQIIREYLNETYKELLTTPCILTSLIIPSEPTKDIVSLVGTFNAEVIKNQITSMPVISINYIEENTINEEYKDFKEEYLTEVKSIITKLVKKSSIIYSFSLDYRLINDELLSILKEKYNESRFTLRIIGEEYILTQETYDKLSFFDEIIVNSIDSNIVSISDSDIIINNSLVIDNIIPNKGYDPINEFYITKDLSEKEYSLVIDKINNTISRVKKLFIRIYNPKKYNSIINNILKYNLEETVEINFLANPLKDKKEDYESFKKCHNKITITYTTNETRLDKLTKEPYSDSAHYIEELECNGKLSISDYINLLYSIEFLEKKSIQLELSQLEKLIYIYRYIEKNSQILSKNELNRERTYSNKNSFAKMFSILARRIDLPCFVYTTNTRLKNISYINDKKYNIERILITDITADVETNRFKNYKIYSFSSFGMSPIDTLKEKTPDYITIPASLVLSEKSFIEYSNSSYNTIVKNNNLTKNIYDFTIKLLNNIGLIKPKNYSISINDYYILLADLLSKGIMVELEESILQEAATYIIKKELNSSRKDQIKFEIENTISSYNLGRKELKGIPYILLNQNRDNSSFVEVSLIEPNSKNQELNKQQKDFVNKAEQIIKEIFKYKKESIICFQNNDNLIEAIKNDLVELYNEKTKYNLVSLSNRKKIIEDLYNKNEKKLYKEIPNKLYNYLKDEIIPEVELITNSREIKYLLSCTEKELDSEEYNRNYLRISIKIKCLMDKLSSQESKKLGITYKYDNYCLTIKVDNPNIKEYNIQIVSAEIVALSKLKNKNEIIYKKEKKYDNKKIKDYIEVYIDKLNKYNSLIRKSNQIILEIEKIDNYIDNKDVINRFIDLEKQLIKLEEESFKNQIEQSNFRNTFLKRFERTITSFDEIKTFTLDKYKYNKKYNEYLELFPQIEQKIVDISKDCSTDINENIEIKELLSFIDYLISYLNRQIINEDSGSDKLLEKANSLYQKKRIILDKITTLDKVAKGLNIVLKDKKLSFKDAITPLLNYKIININKITFIKLINSIKLRLSNQVLNRFKVSKNNK